MSGAGATRFWVDNFDGTGLIGDVPPGARGEWLAHHEKQVDGAGTYYTPRGNEWGHEYFGTFGKSLFTLFQVLTGDSWAEAIGRPLLEGWFPMSTALFFVSFILLHSVVLINVVVGAAQESEIPNFKGSYLGRFPLVSADFWTSDHLLERYRSVDAFSGTRARGTLMLKRT